MKIRTGGDPRFGAVDAEIDSSGNISWIVVAPKTVTTAGKAQGDKYLFFRAELANEERQRVARLVLESDPSKWAQTYKRTGIHYYSTLLTLELREKKSGGRVLYLVQQYTVREKNQSQTVPEDFQSLQAEVEALADKYKGAAPVGAGTDISSSEYASGDKNQWDGVSRINSDPATPISGAEVILYNPNSIRCITAPCPSNEASLKARSDLSGVVLTPGSFIEVGRTDFNVEGYVVEDLQKKTSERSASTCGN